MSGVCYNCLSNDRNVARVCMQHYSQAELTVGHGHEISRPPTF